MQHIYLLFIGRTGSTYIMQILSKCDNCRVLCEYGEIFTSIDVIMKTFKANIKLNIDESNYKKWGLEHPIQYINFINENINSKYLFSKIQVPYIANKNNNIIKNITSNNLIIVKRNLLHSFISYKKAELVGKYSKIDTTNKKIHIDVNEFFKYYKNTNDQFNKITNILSHNNFVVLNYENIHKLKNDDEKSKYIIDCVNKLGLELNYINDFNGLLFKQDNNKQLSDKISNYNEVKLFLIKNKLNYLLVNDV